MGTPFLGELRLFTFGFAPAGWAECAGQSMQIAQNQPLFSLFGNTYGGDGRTTFGLPDLRGRAPLHRGPSLTLGVATGAEAHTLTANELPSHTHGVLASTAAGNTASPGAIAGAHDAYRANVTSGSTTLHPATLSSTGGGQPHENRPPSLALMWCVALSGVFPSRA
jgi:microcystin-dependent protein